MKMEHMPGQGRPGVHVARGASATGAELVCRAWLWEPSLGDVVHEKDAYNLRVDILVLVWRLQ